jgi:plasmid maintenance system antidote protein VapI
VRREHPGQLIHRNILDRHGLSIGDAAHLLSVRRARFSTGKAALSPEMAERIEAVFGTGAGRAGDDLATQANWDD